MTGCIRGCMKECAKGCVKGCVKGCLNGDVKGCIERVCQFTLALNLMGCDVGMYKSSLTGSKNE